MNRSRLGIYILLSLVVMLGSVILWTKAGKNKISLSLMKDSDFESTNNNLDKPDAFLNIDNDPAVITDDEVIQGDIRLIEKALECQYELYGYYPSSLDDSFDQQCLAGKSAPYNYNTGESFRYSTIKNGVGYVLKVKLSTGEIYAVFK